jgi:hypothetical protein
VSTLHNTGARLAGWARTHALLLMAGATAVALVVTVFITTFRIYDERQARLASIEALADEARRLAEENAEQDREQCESDNGIAGTVRFILDAGLRLRSPDNPISPALRQAYIDAYRRLPLTDCDTGAKTYFDPPFPS